MRTRTARNTAQIRIILFLISVAPTLLAGSHKAGQENGTGVSTNRSSRYFTVRDSIEMSRFETDAVPLFSPDNRFFAVVTSRGVLAADSIESTLWVFRTSEAWHFLESQQSVGVQGSAILKRANIPRNNYGIPYAPVISNVSWSPDSGALLFLGQDASGERHLYRVEVASGVVRELTHKGYDVSLYEVQKHTIVCLAAPAHQSIRIGRLINADALDIAGEPLAMFMPQLDDSAYYRELWVIRNDRTWRLSRNGHTIHLANHFPDILSISPDEQSVAVLLPSETVPSSWQSYEPADAYFRLNPNDPGITDSFNFTRPMQYAVFDLATGKARFILNAPHAYALGYVQKDTAIWSADSKRLILTNTFLPLNRPNDVQQEQRFTPCACVVADFDQHSTSCIAWSRYRRSNGSSLAAAAFGPTPNEVILDFNAPPKGISQETYVSKENVWQRAKVADRESRRGKGSIEGPRNSAFPITVEIKETPNQPAALFVTDQKSGQSRKLWDPNPKLSSINLGAVSSFKWIDKTGYEWTGQLVTPPDYVAGRRYPLVIQTYGFSAGFVSDGLFPSASAVRPLAAVGIMVLQMPRRTDHYGTADEAQDQLQGMQSAIERLSDDGLIDPKKVGLAGFSRTSYHVENAIVNDPTRFAAATIADGVDGSYLQYLYSVGDSTANLYDDLYGVKPFGSGLKIWLEHAPGFNLDKVQSPLRIETYSFASLMTQWETYASLFSQGKPVDFVYFPRADHLLQKPLERMASEQGNVDWFRFWLKNEEDFDPLKRLQYARWRKMREQAEHGEGSKD